MKPATMKRIVEAHDAIDRFGEEGMYHAKKILKEIIDEDGRQAGRPANRRLCGEVFAKRGCGPKTPCRSSGTRDKTAKEKK